MRMTETKSAGISKTMFMIGLIIAILASSLISVFAAMQWALIKGPKGDKGDKGDTGATGSQGLQGIQGPKGDKGDTGPATVFAQWNLTWYTLSGSLQWGASVGTSTWGAVFDYDFGGNAMFGSYSSYIGFVGTMTINKQTDGPVHFAIGSDDGSQLLLDGTNIVNNWGTHTYIEKGVTISVAKGFHVLVLQYYQVGGASRVSFNCDPDVLMWNP
jgi:hypothetical protein